jgi:GalNAc-alpha-(1->4)-GalNAc-alpha-(1->3)-diNAcBac-PP-undecaprenol alpha-1,4-N-acetyl-D-galactosaminyltransferase
VIGSNRVTDIAFLLEEGFKGGGAERVALNLISHWVAQGRTVRLITTTEAGEDFYVVPDGVDRITLPAIQKAPGGRGATLMVNIWRTFALRAVLKQLPSPVVISFLTVPNIRTIVACCGLGKRVIVSERNDTSRQRHHWLWTSLRRICYRFADVVTANSAGALEDMGRYVDSTRLAFVPNPITVPAERAHPASYQTVLTVGRLSAQKNQRMLIEAFAGIAGDRGEWTLEICGRGPEEACLRGAIRELGLEGKVVLHGQVPRPDPYYLAAGVFVLTSIYEGTPNVLLEAMAYGLPCIVPDNLTGALAYIDDGVTGLVYDHEDFSDLSRKMSALMVDPEMRAKIGAAARERMRDCSIDRVAGVWDALFVARLCRIAPSA